MSSRRVPARRAFRSRRIPAGRTRSPGDGRPADRTPRATSSGGRRIRGSGRASVHHWPATTARTLASPAGSHSRLVQGIRSVETDVTIEEQTDGERRRARRRYVSRLTTHGSRLTTHDLEPNTSSTPPGFTAGGKVGRGGTAHHREVLLAIGPGEGDRRAGHSRRSAEAPELASGLGSRPPSRIRRACRRRRGRRRRECTARPVRRVRALPTRSCSGSRPRR